MSTKHCCIVSLVALLIAILGCATGPQLNVEEARAAGDVPIVVLPAAIAQGSYQVQGKRVAIDRYDLTDDRAPIPACGQTRVALHPSLIIEVTQPLPDDLEVFSDGVSGTLLFEDGKSYCIKNTRGDLSTVDWQPGVYAFYPTDSGMDGKGAVSMSFAMPAQLVEEATAALTASSVKLSSALNPQYIPLAPPSKRPMVSARYLNLETCGKRKQIKDLRPVASVEITSKSTYKIQVGRHKQFLMVGSDGTCYESAHNTSGTPRHKINQELAADVYHVWALAWSDESFEHDALIIEDLERDLSFGEAPMIAISEDDPLKVMKVKVAQKPQMRSFCGVGGREPLFSVKSADNRKVRVRVLEGGPVDHLIERSSEPKREAICDNAWFSSEGEVIHVFPGSQQVKDELIVAIGEIGFEDLLRKTDELPEGKLSLKDRGLNRFYGVFAHAFLQRRPSIENVEALFVEADARLHVFAREAREGMLANEPLLLIAYGEEKSRVLRVNGEALEVRTSSLSEQPAGAIQLPELAKIEKIDRIAPIKSFETSEMIRHIGVPEIPLVNAMWERRDAYKKCSLAWLREKDPTWNLEASGYWVLTYTGVQMRKKYIAQVEKVCGWKKVEAFQEETFDEIYASQLATRKAFEQTMSERFR